MEFMPPYAPVVVLLFLGTCFALGLTALIAAYGLARGHRLLVKAGLLAAVGGAGLYGVLLLSASFASHESVLRPGEMKYFCEVDCHLAYSVESVETAKTLGAPPLEKTAAGTFYIVKLKTWFDERTISNHRGNAPLWPNPRSVMVVDAQGRQFAPSAEALAAIAQARARSTPLTQPLRPGESYTTLFVFDLPPEAQSPRLLLTASDAVARLLIGHEASPFHKKIYFSLAPQSKSAFLGSTAVVPPKKGDFILRRAPEP